MKKTEPQQKGQVSTDPVASPPAPIRLVEAFRDAVRASKPEPEISREALAVEVLAIAGLASFDALRRLDELSSMIEREGGPQLSVARWEIGLANQNWHETAMSLYDRSYNLRRDGCESGHISAFEEAIRKAWDIETESKERAILERQALGSEQLTALMTKLEPRQEVYDEEGDGRSITATSRSSRPCLTPGGGTRRTDPL